MSKDWSMVLVASLFELVWVTGLAHAATPIQYVITGIGVIVSFVLLTMSIKRLPVGTVYAIFAGLGSNGSIIVGYLFFNETISPAKIIFMGTLLIGIIGLKLVESPTEEESEEQK